MVRYRAHIYFVGLMISYFIVRYVRVSFTNLPDFIRFYLTDLIFVPAMAVFALIAVRFLKRDASIRIPAHLVFIQVAFVSVFFEWYLPNFSGKIGWYTGDLLDVVMYVLGGFAFLLIQRKI